MRMGWRGLFHKENHLSQEGSAFKTKSPPRSNPPNTITWGIRFQNVNLWEHKHSDHNMTLHAKIRFIHTSFSEILLQSFLGPKPVVVMLGDGSEGGFTIDFKTLKKQK